MASTENLVKSSFFDELNEESELENMKSSNGLNKKSGLWIKLKNFTLNELNERFLYFCNEILFEGKLIKKSKKHRVLKHKYFVLYKDRLEQYEVLTI